MATILMNAQQRAAKVALKEERTRDAALAMREYKAEELAVRANTARLQAVRFAKEAASRQHTKTKEPAKEDGCAHAVSIVATPRLLDRLDQGTRGIADPHLHRGVLSQNRE